MEPVNGITEPCFREVLLHIEESSSREQLKRYSYKGARARSASDPTLGMANRSRSKGGVIINRWQERSGPVLYVVPPSYGKVKMWGVMLLVQRYLKSVKRLAGSLVASEMQATYGTRFLWMLATYYFGLKGYASQMVLSITLPYFRALGVSGTKYQLANIVAATPWSMKGLVGVLSDVVPIFGYHKRSYMVLYSFMGIFGTLWMLAMFDYLPVAHSIVAKGEESFFGLWGLACAAFMCNMYYAGMDLLCQGKYSEMMREADLGASIASPRSDIGTSREEAGDYEGASDEGSSEPNSKGSSAVIALVWGCVQTGSLIGALLLCLILQGGKAADVGSQLCTLTLVGVPFVFLMFYFVCRGFMPERRVCTVFGTIRWHKVRAQPRLFMLALAMALGSCGLALTAVFVESSSVQLIITFSISFLLVIGGFFSLPRRLALSNLYMFIQSAVYLDLSGPLGYFYTGGPECVVDGPNFSYGYYISVSATIGSVTGLLGTAIFQKYMSDWTYRRVFNVTTLVQVLAAVSDIIIVNRWNLQVGLSDKLTYLFGDAAVQPLAQMLVLMPQGLLTSRLCPAGSEATVFAIMAGFQNFGQNVASVMGVWLAERMNIHAGTSGNCNFDHLFLAIVIGHCLLPLINIPLTTLMIPPERMDESIEDDLEDMNEVPEFPESPSNSPKRMRKFPEMYM